MDYVLAIDQGTSGSKAIIFDSKGRIEAQSTTEVSSRFFNDGFVEQNPEDIYASVISAVKNTIGQFLAGGRSISSIVACGISNQRETFVLWDKSGSPATNAVIWQCKRSVEICARLKAAGKEQTIRDKSGLTLDPYFSGTKVLWLLENDAELRAKCQEGNLYFGTIDTWLLYRLTGGVAYSTDFTNASRTLFFNLDTLKWDSELIDIFGAGRLNLPEIKSSSAPFGSSTFNGIFPFAVPVNAMIGDSHAASFGEGCLIPGTVKATMGTGSSVMMNTGEKRIRSSRGLVSTICWSAKGRIDYALEGVIVSCGSTVNWLQNQLGIVTSGKNFDILAESVTDSGNVVFLPAFSGLGGPHWQMDRKAEITGIGFGTTAAHIVRAALESYPFQLKDVIAAMEADTGKPLQWLKADGGLTNSRLTMQYIAELLECRVLIDTRKEASALGAGLLAFLEYGTLSLGDIEILFQNAEQDMYVSSNNVENVYIKKNYEKWLKVVYRR